MAAQRGERNAHGSRRWSTLAVGIAAAAVIATGAPAASMASSDSSLAGLTTNAGALLPAFGPANPGPYTAGPVYYSTPVTVTATSTDANAMLQVCVNGGPPSPIVSGVPSGALALKVGTNTLTVVVTSEDFSTVHSYKLKIKRLSASSNAFLNALSTTAGPLTTVFVPKTTSYSAGPTSASTADVSATAQGGNATIQFRVNNGAYSPPAGSPATTAVPLALNVGANTIQVKVTAENGKSSRVYSIAVTRTAGPDDSSLSALSTTAGPLSPAFLPATIAYTAGPVSNATSSVKVTATTAGAFATLQVSVNGGAFGPLTSGVASGPLALNVGTNTIDVLVTSQDTSTTTDYTIQVVRNDTGGGGGGGGNSDLTACATTYSGVTFTGSVSVASGATCTLTGGLVSGSVLVQAGGTFIGNDGLRVYGAILATGATSVTVDKVTVNGPVQLMNVTGASSVCRSSASDVIAIGNTGSLSIGDSPPCSGGNTLAGSVQALNNGALVKVSNNKIGGPLLCIGNTPAPSGVAGSNTAVVKIGQCTSL